MPSGYAVVYGHGGFIPQADTPFFSVPADTELYYLTEPLKTLYMSSGDLMREWEAADLERNVVQWVSESRTAWNYEVRPDDEALGLEGKVTPPDGVEFDIIKANERLEAIVARHAGKTVVMATCRVVLLEDAGGSAMGVNIEGLEVEGSDLIPSEDLREQRERGDRDFVPQGVTQCDSVCPTCGQQCRWNDEHVGHYEHRCESDHEWPEP